MPAIVGSVALETPPAIALASPPPLKAITWKTSIIPVTVPSKPNNGAILIAVGPTGEVWMDGRRIDVRQVKANVVKLLADNPQGSVVIQADEKAVADTIIKVMDGAREAGVSAISLASEPK